MKYSHDKPQRKKITEGDYGKLYRCMIIARDVLHSEFDAFTAKKEANTTGLDSDLYDINHNL